MALGMWIAVNANPVNTKTKWIVIILIFERVDFSSVSHGAGINLIIYFKNFWKFHNKVIKTPQWSCKES